MGIRMGYLYTLQINGFFLRIPTDTPSASRAFTVTLETYVDPSVGELSMAAVDAGLVLGILEPTWITKTETASRVRGLACRFRLAAECLRHALDVQSFSGWGIA